MLVDVTPPEGVTCTQFQLEGETSLSYTQTPSFRHETYNASLEVNVPARKHLLKMVVTATALNPGALGELVVEPHLRMPLTFRFDRSSNARAEHVFLAPAGGRTRVGVEVRADAGASVSARVFSCAKASPSSTEAVTLRQLSDRAVSVCATVVDEESDVMSLWVGVGSTPGGLQLQPFMPLGQSGHVEVEVSSVMATEGRGKVNDTGRGKVSDKGRSKAIDKRRGKVSDKGRGKANDKGRGKVSDKGRGKAIDKRRGKVSDKRRGKVRDKGRGKANDKGRGKVSDKGRGKANDKRRGKVSDEGTGKVNNKGRGKANMGKVNNKNMVVW